MGDVVALKSTVPPAITAKQETAVLASTGLSEMEARRQLDSLGPNEIPGGKVSSGLIAILLNTLREPMFLLLLAAAVIYAFVGSAGEAAIIGIFALITIGLVIFQRRRGDKALAALANLAAPMARVIRDSTTRLIPATEVVPGDWLSLSEGERVSADAILRISDGLVADESIVTGESVPVRKAPATVDANRATLLAGSFIVSGHGLAEVTATGAKSHIGGIGASLASIAKDDTVTQRRIAGLVRIFGVLAIVLSGLLVALQVASGTDWTAAALSGIALAMALLPEEFPVVLVIFLTLGAMRMSRIHVLVRRSAAIETLGATTVLCVDKTGTLTENRMSLAGVHAQGQTATENLPRHPVLAIARQATNAHSADPIDRAISSSASDVPAVFETVSFTPFSAKKPATVGVLKDTQSRFKVAMKGAPEFVLECCALSPQDHRALTAELSALAANGWRVLAVAESDPLNTRPDDAFQVPLRFCGFLLFEDPLRPSVRGAVAEATRAGVKVVMITGDYPATAQAIAAQAGIDGVSSVITGDDLNGWSDDELKRHLPAARVFARVRPEQKLRIVQAYAALGDIVAMTGDGVNDAPALKAAHIGIAIGPRGTDVAREASDIVLLQDDFGLIVRAVRQGRRIFDNLRKVMVYVTSIHVVIAGLAFTPILLGLPIILWPVHVAMTEMVIDPLCSLGFEGEPDEPDIMDRPPRPISDPVIGFRELAFGIVQGLVLLVGCLTVFRLALAQGLSEEAARTVTFVTLTTGNLLLILVNSAFGSVRGRVFSRGHLVFWLIAAATMLILVTLIAVPGLRALLKFELISASQFGLAVGIGTGIAAVLETAKVVARQFKRKSA
ncbi:MAG: cation-translocating P-type ATPase [Beijerinckiaceae bacterium]